MQARRTRLVALLLLTLLAAGCGVLEMNGPYTLSIAPGLHPRLIADEAISITRGYLDAQTPQIAAPEEHIPPHVTGVWAVPANAARTIDGCIPAEASGQIVWITKGVGDYLNLSDHPWSPQSEASDLTCSGPGPAGTIVIDDVTQVILGVYPGDPVNPHPGASASPGLYPEQTPWGDRVPTPAPALVADQPVVTRGPDSITLLPISPSGATVGVAYGFDMPHCGILSPIDVDGSFWDPVDRASSSGFDGLPGTFRLDSHTTATFMTTGGQVLKLGRHAGSKAFGFCQ